MSNSRNDGTIALFIGLTRSGKSLVVKRAAERHSRVIAFDPKGELVTQYGFERITSGADLVRRCKTLGAGAAKLAFIASSPKDFDLFAGAAYIWNMAAPCCIVAEELARVTNPAKAAGNWGRLVNQGLAFGPTILATVQRGQEVDKTVLNSASFVHVCRHGMAADQEYIAGMLGCSVELIPSKPLEFLQWTSDKGVVCRGTVDFPKPSKYWPKGAPRFRGRGGNRKVLTVNSSGQFNQVVYR